MPARRPLVVIAGWTHELPVGDTLTVATPVNATDASSKGYADGLMQLLAINAATSLIHTQKVMAQMALRGQLA